MKGKLSAAWDRLRCFCVEQCINFYVGMAMAVLLMLSLSTIIATVPLLIITPFASGFLYLALRCLVQPPNEWGSDMSVLRGLLSTSVGGLYAVILTLL